MRRRRITRRWGPGVGRGVVDTKYIREEGGSPDQSLLFFFSGIPLILPGILGWLLSKEGWGFYHSCVCLFCAFFFALLTSPSLGRLFGQAERRFFSSLERVVVSWFFFDVLRGGEQKTFTHLWLRSNCIGREEIRQGGG